MERLFLALVLLLAWAGLANAASVGILVEEGDGSPTGYAYKLLVPNGSLSLTSSVATMDFSSVYGDVYSVGDCTSGACFDGSSDGGTYLRLYDGTANYLSLVIPSALGANRSFYFPVGAPTANTLLGMNSAGTSLEYKTTFSVSAIEIGSGTLEIPNGTADEALANGGEISLNTTDEQLTLHSAADGEISGEASISLIQHISIALDPTDVYANESTYRSYPLMYLGDDAVEGITITEWRVAYVGGDPTTELDADLICDTTPDFNTAAGATVMDVLDTTTGASTADTGFDSASCANGSRLYIHFGANPTDANVMIAFDLWYYYEAD